MKQFFLLKTDKKQLIFATFCFAFISSIAQAWQPPEAVHNAARRFMEQETQGLPGSVTITLGSFDPNNALPPCTQLQAFLPANARAWGTVNLGIRCDTPVSWTAYLQAHVSVTANYLITTQPLRANQIISPTDVTLQQGDLTAQPDSVLTELTQAVGYNTRYAIASGSPLRSDMLRIPPIIKQGQTVRVISKGHGFEITTEGRALKNAASGETVRVQLLSGQTVTGVARNDGAVEISF